MKARIMLWPFVLGAVLLALVMALLGCASRGSKQTNSNQTTSSNQTPVPSQVREAIVKDYPVMAFLPGRLPSGYRYANWTHFKTGYQLVFLHGSVTNQVDLQVLSRPCPAPPKGPAKATLHVNGHTLKWLQTNHGAIVWRCMTNRGRSFVIFGVNGPRQKLTDLVGHALPAH